jgi:uncharacterized membrane protein
VHLLFWLSLVPFATAWLGEAGALPEPTALYGAILLFAGVAYFLLTRALLAIHGPDSRLAAALGADWKGKASVLAYLVAIPLAFVSPWVATAIYVTLALVWFVPDVRFERTTPQFGSSDID